jgi:hypothetical protein
VITSSNATVFDFAACLLGVDVNVEQAGALQDQRPLISPILLGPSADQEHEVRFLHELLGLPSEPAQDP